MGEAGERAEEVGFDKTRHHLVLPSSQLPSRLQSKEKERKVWGLGLKVSRQRVASLKMMMILSMSIYLNVVLET